MVVLNGGEDILDRIPIPVMKLSWNDNPAEESIVHEEWKSAVETLLPRLLRPRKNSEDNGQQQRATEEDSSIFRDFGRWLSSFGGLVSSKLYRNPSTASLTTWQMKDFLILLEKPTIREFLATDHCMLLADSYLLAVVFTYFIRAGLSYKEYNEKNFFVALTLAHEVEEENYIFEVFVIDWEAASLEADEREFVPMHHLRYELFTRMNYRALVSRKCCEEVMSTSPEHWAWKRRRLEHHSGVFQERRYLHMESTSFSFWELAAKKNRSTMKPCEECSRIFKKQRDKKTNKRLSLKKRPKTEEQSAEENEKKLRR